MVTLLVKFDPKRAFQPVGFAIMSGNDFKIFVDDWVQQLNSYGEIDIDLFPYDTVWFSDAESFIESFSVREIFSEHELEILREVLPNNRTDSFPNFCDKNNEEVEEVQNFDIDDIPF